MLHCAQVTVLLSERKTREASAGGAWKRPVNKNTVSRRGAGW